MEQGNNSVKDLIRIFHEALAGRYPEREVRQFVYILFEEYLGWSKTRVHLSPSEKISDEVKNKFNLALGELISGKPLQYIINKAWFNGTLLRVDSTVLIPRPETEQLCSIIKSEYSSLQHQPGSILDIGTGSGCIAIDLKKHFMQASVSALDYSADALDTARLNAQSNNIDINFIHASILEHDALLNSGRYDLIVSNPPYVVETEKALMHQNVLDYEPSLALFVSEKDPLVFYRAVAGFATTHLNPGSRLYLEINERFGGEVCDLLKSFGFPEVTLQSDLHGKDRFVVAVFH